MDENKEEFSENSNSKLQQKDKEYSYSFVDDSFLCSIMHKLFVTPILKRLPESVKPNTITVISGVFSFTAFILMLQAGFGKYHLWGLIPILFLLNVISDYLDGEQARKTKQFSSVGEFLDHFFDSCIPGFIVGGIFITYRIYNPFLLFFSVGAGYFAQSSAFWERYKTGKMHFSSFSSTETILTISLVIFLGGFNNLRDFLKTPLLFNISLIYAFIIIASVSAYIATFHALKRSKIVTPKYLSSIALSIITAYLLYRSNFTLEIKIILFLMYNMHYNSGLLTAITMKKNDKYPDVIFPALLIIFHFIGSDHIYVQGALGFAYLTFALVSRVFNLMFIYIKE